MPRFCASFQPRSRAQQLAAIGLTGPKGEQPSRALCRCFDPSGGEWEDIEPPRPHEWLDAHLEKTPDQSFRDFIMSRPNVPDRTRNVIYLQPLCHPRELEGPVFPEGTWPSWSVLETAVKRFYMPLEVRTLDPVPMESLRPLPASRENHYGTQWNAKHVLEAMRGRLPRNAFCTLAVTMCDLYPRDEWNFVYGLAELKNRVGVFSFVRHTPGMAPAAWRGAQLLHRSIKTMLHEIGHMFGMKHCTWFNCLMRGSNGEEVEHQKNNLHLCPVCLRKLHSSLEFNILQRYECLLELYKEYEASNEFFQKDCDFLRKRLDALKDLSEEFALPPEVEKAPARSSMGRVRRVGSPAGSRGGAAAAAQNASRSPATSGAVRARMILADGRSTPPEGKRALTGTGRSILADTSVHTSWRVT